MKRITIRAGMLALCITLAACNGQDHNGKDHQHGETTDTIAAGGPGTAAEANEVAYACPMHPEVTGNKGDACSKCGMELEEVQ